MPTPTLRAAVRSSLLAAALLAGAGPAGAASLVANGDFETGVLTPWAAANGAGIDAAFPNGGSFDASFGTATQVAATLAQTLATAPGTAYTLSFVLLDEAISALDTFTVTFGSFSATITGDLAFDAAQPGGFAVFSFLVPGAAIVDAATALMFAAVNDLAAFNLDDVVVTPGARAIPEPGALWPLLLALPLGLRAARRVQLFQTGRETP